MPTKRKKGATYAERLAKSVSKSKKASRAGRARKNPLREKLGGDTRRAMANERDVSPLARLMGAFIAEKIRFQLIGMSAAVLQGVPVATLDVDLWVDLPVRSYMRAANLALTQGATFVRNTVVELADGTLVNFIFEVTGLKDFATELRKARKLRFHGLDIPVMPLELIRKSKLAIMRPKDPAHIHYIDETLRALKANRRKK
jgi:hypothetical protein